MSHNWSAMKQRLHPQSVDEISRHSVLSGDRIRQCETSPGSRHKDTDIVQRICTQQQPVYGCQLFFLSIKLDVQIAAIRKSRNFKYSFVYGYNSDWPRTVKRKWTSNWELFDERLRSRNSSWMLPASAVLISTNDGCLRRMLIRLHGTAVTPVKHGISASPSFICTKFKSTTTRLNKFGEICSLQMHLTVRQY